MQPVQLKNNVVDISTWKGEEESRIFPVGTREKKLVYCPVNSPYTFVEKGHRYLFKLSVRKCPEQFWIEIFAYHLGQKMGVEVPPTFVAIDDREQQCGALIRWFLEDVMLGENTLPAMEKFASGGDLIQGYIENFDRKSGSQHNLETISNKIFQEKYPQVEWKQHWAKTFVFDALIGNTDRHQDNWGLITNKYNSARITPAFDNGTSMGHEIKADRFHLYADDGKLNRYIAKGMHHIRWDLEAAAQLQHGDFLKKYTTQFPETRETVLDCLNRINTDFFQKVFADLIQFDIPVKLTGARADFMLRLLGYRHKMLLNLLGS
jgi:hypothetical protein